MSSSPVTIVTGSSRGIGRATAELLAARGHRVVISSRNQDSCEAVAAAINENAGEQGGEAVAIACHVGQEDQRVGLIESTAEHFGGIDNLVLNAASNPVYGDSDNVDQKAFDVIMHNNVLGSLRLSHLARPSLAAAGQGSIVMVSSIAGQLGNRMIGAYGLSKAAEDQMVRNLALEFGRDGIRVNAVAPGLIRTDFSKALLQDERMVKHFERTTPLGRIGEPDDIARVIAFLTGPDSGWLSGQVITADGGISVTGGF